MPLPHLLSNIWTFLESLLIPQRILALPLAVFGIGAALITGLPVTSVWFLMIVINFLAYAGVAFAGRAIWDSITGRLFGNVNKNMTDFRQDLKDFKNEIVSDLHVLRASQIARDEFNDLRRAFEEHANLRGHMRPPPEGLDSSP